MLYGLAASRLFNSCGARMVTTGSSRSPASVSATAA